ncbi:hypothetical protein DEO72_LG8g2077 [Vigna unguiculata]|uniref:Uncharacterized protein n=1 Tax=Vigna unguiculata TaxID=3917 RepID=A0A4D6MTE8_VIGUN|nr:hypothetical protein DEO72_LG8g2077 [Vigna unguiculata]
MAQHLPIQAKHHCQSKQHTRKQRTTAFPPGSAHTPLGETVPDRLAVFTHRQAPASSQTHCFLVTAWRTSPCRQAPLSAGFPHAASIAWRGSTSRQAPYQRHSAADIWHSILNSLVQHPFKAAPRHRLADRTAPPGGTPESDPLINAIKQHTIKVAPPGRNSSPPGDSNQNKNTRSSLMSRLAVGIKPPGGFWEKPRNPIEQCRNRWKHAISMGYDTMQRTCN